MISYTTLEEVTNEELFDAFMKSFQGFRITTEATYESFCEMLAEQKYDPFISVGAFEIETGELVSYVLNCIVENKDATAYDILTGTIPDYRRRGISKTIFEKIKRVLKQKDVKVYTTEVLKSNPEALNLYLSVGFTINAEVVKTIKTPKGNREVLEYEITMNL